MVPAGGGTIKRRNCGSERFCWVTKLNYRSEIAESRSDPIVTGWRLAAGGKVTREPGRRSQPGAYGTSTMGNLCVLAA
jgi:hypothetical protein